MDIDKARYCDLHTHSVYSDGTKTPREIIECADAIGLSAVALTDHNTTAGLAEFLSPDVPCKVKRVSGIEVSTDYGDKELHVIGLFLPSGALGRVDELMGGLRKRKEDANRDMIARLRRAGYDVDFDELKSSSRGLFNRAHIAAELTKKGYTGSISEAFSYLLSKKGPFYVRAERLPVFDVIEFISEIGAVPIIAHPFLNLTEDELTVFLRKAVMRGLCGMETVYSTYDEKTAAVSARLARDFGLLESGGSDFHGENKPDISLGTGRGNLAVPHDFLEKLEDFFKNGNNTNF